MDLLRQPVIGRMLRWRRLRVALQLLVLAAAALVVLHGLLGPQIAPRNLATVLTSIHWRGMLVASILVAGNLFCTACPMVLVRDAGRRLVAPTRRWPRRLRGKWLALAVLVSVFFFYELFDLWEQPAATAWIVLGYFGLALAVDLAFRGASFCKHVCPIGQFNFVASTLSPLELRVRDGGTCRACRTSDCIKGRYGATVPRRLEQRGCELGLFLPAKAGNLDCTFCLDCVHACPHGNVAIAARVPGLEWLSGNRRSGVGRVWQRADLMVLAVVFVFGALLSALAMTAPAYALETALQGTLGGEAPVLALLFAAALILVPAVLLAGAAAATRRFTGVGFGIRTTAAPFVFALVPLGLGVWVAHYGFHLLTGVLSIVPVIQSAAIDLLGRPALGEPAWQWAGMRSGTVYPIQLGFVTLGAAGSAGLVRAVAARDYARHASRAAAPWLVLVAGLALAAMWIFAQPMEMRGMGMAG